ncbi:ubiquinone anaerobic biosynthesis accessory factor UbiT [Thorsellia anophelis]|uniref:Ubiquinone biosynthesis accessory factor UbiT n=1 Tax=Thorsellia anophelis DSM 18579 TaxID=1123402 RepID=A0A1H9YZ08_9GAMM|nr:SCP2 sterol-binding domain-containing protein [Thorsellia anophelis]SES73824.1 Predicted lipid carrier protein YhbT, contains SCP2 domain [Thorsellia anophelis DSM 18579]
MDSLIAPPVLLKYCLPIVIKTLTKYQLKLIPKLLINQVLSDAFNHALQVSIREGEFDFLRDKWLKIEISDLDFSWSITYKNHKLIIANPIVNQAVLSGDSQALLLIAAQVVDADTLFFQRRLRIEGDTEFALEVKNTLDAIDREDLALLYQAPLSWLEKVLKHAYIQ